MRPFSMFFFVITTALVACGQTAMFDLESLEATREPDGRVTIKGSISCIGAGDDDCEGGGCVIARWDGADGGGSAVESDRVCWTRTIRKRRNDVEAFSLTSAAPISGTPDAVISVEAGGRVDTTSTSVPTPASPLHGDD